MLAYFRAPVSWRELSRRTVAEIVEDGVPGLAAQLAFYFLLSVFPALLFLVALLAYLPVDTALGSTLARLQTVMPQEAMAIVRDQLERVSSGANGGLLTFSIAGAVWSSSSAMTAIISALNRAYDIHEWRSWWKIRLVAIVLTIALAVFVVAAFALILGGVQVGEWLADRTGLGSVFQAAWSIAQWPVALLLVFLAVDLVYYCAPNADTEWVWLTPGSVLATVLWLLVSVGFKWYVHTFGDYSAIYGALGGFIVLMLWLYLSGFALLVGAELNAEIDHAMPTRDDGVQRPGRKKKIGPAAEKAA
jgi:membrane protein